MMDPLLFKDPSTLEKRKLKAKEISMNNDEACSSSSSSTRSVSRVAHRLRIPRVRFGMARRSVRERKAEALALGMSFAAFANLVIEKKSGAGQNTNVADLALIYASAVKESLANVYGHKLGCFAERSFNSTLRILNDSAFAHQLDNHEKAKPEMAAFETELEDTGIMVTRTKIWLVVSVFNILACVLSVSQPSVMESTSICEYEATYYRLDSEQVSPYLAEFNRLICRHEFWVQAYLALFMMTVVMILTICRLSDTKLVTFNVLCLGVGCGLLAKFCVDAMGGNGNLWLFVWALFCVLQFFVDVFTLAFMYGIKRFRVGHVWCMERSFLYCYA